MQCSAVFYTKMLHSILLKGFHWKDVLVYVFVITVFYENYKQILTILNVLIHEMKNM